MNKTSLFALAGLIAAISGCRHYQPIKREKLTINLQETVSNPTVVYESPWITIWVHGTRLTPDMIFHDFFHSPDGLVSASDFGNQYHLHKIAKTLSEADPINYPFETFYLFGWSGKLDFKERTKAANDLYAAINQLVATYRNEHNGKTPKIRIITHSHGGNVVLNMAKIKKDRGFIVDQLILLACPVQKKTALLVEDPLFQEMISLYSSRDLLQVIDPQGIYKHKKPRPLFSERCFESEKITQICIKLNGRSLMHIDFIRLNFVQLLPRIITKIQSQFPHHKLPDGKAKEPIKILSIKTAA